MSEPTSTNPKQGFSVEQYYKTVADLVDTINHQRNTIQDLRKEIRRLQWENQK